MIPLTSTYELQNWLGETEKTLVDNTTKFIMVTNMTRVEEGVENEEAGVEAIKEFKKFASEGQVFVYIHSVEKAIQKLKKHKLINSNNKIEVSNKIGDLI